MVSRTVRTKDELQRAYDDKVDEIIVEGKLAKKMKKTQKLRYVAPATLAGLGGAIAVVAGGIATAPVTGGMSAIASGSAVLAISASTGLNAAAVIIAVSVGITLLTHVFKEYDEVEIGYGGACLKLKRKGAVEENE